MPKHDFARRSGRLRAVTLGRWLAGVVAVGVVLAAFWLCARVLRRRLAPSLLGSAAVLADAVLALALLLAALQLLGVAGLLEGWTICVTAAVAGAYGLSHRGAAADGGRPSARRTGLVALAVGAIVAAAWLRRTLVALDLGVGGVDSLWYHLPFATRFAQDGSITGVPYVDLEFLTAFYPANVELLHAGGMLAFGTDALSPWLNLGCLALGLLAGWCFGAARGAGPAGLVAAAVVFAVPTMVESQAGEAKNDAFALALLLAAAALLLHAGGERDRARTGVVVIAGLAAGMALGAKLSFLAPAGALLLVVVALAPPGRRVRLSGVWLAALLATSAVWFVRDLVVTGNPLPWLGLGPLPNPAQPRSGPTADTLVAYLFDAGAWDAFFLPGLETALGPAWWAILALTAIGAVLALRDRDRAVRALGVVTIVAAAAYVVTPSTAAGPDGEPVGFVLNVRYLLPAVLLGLCLLALHRRGRLAAVALALVVAVTQAADPVWADEHRRKAIALVVLALGAVAAARLVRAPRWVLPAGALAALVLAWPLARDHDRQAYTGLRLPYTSWAAFQLEGAYAWARREHGARIAVTGTTGAFFQYPLAGRERQNVVRVLGEHGPHGSFTPLRDCGAFRRALAGFTHVVVTPDLDIWDPYHPLPSRERGWLEGTGAREVVPGTRVSVHALPAAVDAAGCPDGA